MSYTSLLLPSLHLHRFVREVYIHFVDIVSFPSCTCAGWLYKYIHFIHIVFFPICTCTGWLWKRIHFLHIVFQSLRERERDRLITEIYSFSPIVLRPQSEPDCLVWAFCHNTLEGVLSVTSLLWLPVIVPGVLSVTSLLWLPVIMPGVLSTTSLLSVLIVLQTFVNDLTIDNANASADCCQWPHCCQWPPCCQC